MNRNNWKPALYTPIIKPIRLSEFVNSIVCKETRKKKHFTSPDDMNDGLKKYILEQEII